LQIDTWIYEEKIDYLKYEIKPVFKVAKIASGHILDSPSKITRNILYLRRHEIDTEDAYF